MNDRDIRVVESMFQSGMDKETVISLFPKFSKEEIENLMQISRNLKKRADR